MRDKPTTFDLHELMCEHDKLVNRLNEMREKMLEMLKILNMEENNKFVDSILSGNFPSTFFSHKKYCTCVSCVMNGRGAFKKGRKRIK